MLSWGMAFQKVPENDLDRAVRRMGRSQSALPDLLRELVKGELWFLVRHQNEIDGMVMKIENGTPVPFERVRDSKGELTPIFSSFERMGEALRNGKVPENRYAGGAMPGQDLLMLLAHLQWRTVLNLSCSTGQIELSQNMMRDLGSGAVFKPIDGEEGVEDEEVPLRRIDPADYPTDLLQPLFEILRKYSEFRAAWVFLTHRGEVTDEDDWTAFQIMLHRESLDEVAMHDFRLVVASMASYQAYVGILDANDPDYLEQIWDFAPPFYAAKDHPRLQRDGL